MERGWRKPSTSMPSDLERAAGRAFTARYTDGRSAAAATVQVRLDERGIAIAIHGAEPLIWPYGALSTAAPLHAGAHDVLVRYAHQKGATLFVEDGAFTAGLAAAAQHLTVRAVRIKHATPWLWAFAGVLMITAIVWAMNLSPARMVAHLLPDSTRAALGAQVVRSMSANRRLCTSPDGVGALARMVGRLSEAADARKPFRVVVVDWGLVNAFAAPGEQIVLTRGLIGQAGGPDEVAGVLAHEMGHGLELHPETGVVRATGIAAAIELMSGGSSGMLANIGQLLLQLSYTRAAESEADQQALRLLRGAKISQQGIIDFFSRVEKQDGSGAGRVDMLRTHPQIAERKRIAASVPSYPATPALSEADWQALKAICAP